MPRITPIPTTRVSDSLVYQRSLSQLQSDQVDLLRLQQQISTGRRVQLPSQDAPAALRAVALQRLLEQKTQVKTNLQTNNSYLSATDSALANVSNLLSEAKGSALGVSGTVATDLQREATAQELDRALQQLVDTGNQQFRDRFLFAGSRTNQVPFETKGNFVRFNGNETDLQSFSDVDILFETNASGSEVFGALSTAVEGTTDLNPIVNGSTQISSLYNGNGIELAGILVSDGVNSSTVDLSAAHTLQDVADLLEANPPFGRKITADVTPNGLSISLDSAGGGSLRISEVGSGTTATQLGIIANGSLGIGPVVSSDLNTRLQLTTQLSDLTGVRAFTRLDATGGDNALLIEANARGAANNGYNFNFVDDTVSGSESVTYNAGTQTYTIHIAEGVTTAAQVRDVLNADATFNARFGAAIDPTRDPDNNGLGHVVATTTGTTASGSGAEFDQTSGLQILNGDQTHTIDISAAETIEDLLNTLNASDADVLAELNANGTSINIRSRLSGADFAIGENGGTTATQLGVRTLTGSTRLNELNHGLGIHPNEIGDDFIIRRKDGVELRFDVSAAQTIDDVITQINTHANNLNPASRVVARLATNGNGLEIVDDGLTGAGALTITKVNNSQAAEDLGLIPVGQSTVTSGAAPAAFATTTVSPGGANNDLRFTATQSGPQRNGAQIVWNNTALGSDTATAVFNAGTNTLTIDYDAAFTTANTVVAAVAAEPSGAFAATLDTAVETTNTGAGLIGAAPATAIAAGGTSNIVTGRDTNPLEVKSVFSALIRLRTSLRANELNDTHRAFDLIEDSISGVNFSRAELGARQQGLDVLSERLESESIDLEAALSDEIEVDLAEAISDLTARQATLQASLQITAQISRLTLLDYL